MKVHAHFQQKTGGDATQEWLEIRAGKITSSEFYRIVDSEGNLRKGQMPKTYLAEKLAERWTGRASGGFISMAVNNGVIVEEKASAFASLEYGLDIKHVGFVESEKEEDANGAGCSPDGLVGRGRGLKIAQPACSKAQPPTGAALKSSAPNSRLTLDTYWLESCRMTTGARFRGRCW